MAERAFEFFVPVSLCKSGTGEEEEWMLSGPLSSERIDLQGETVLFSALQKGLKTFLEYGMPVDYNHLSLSSHSPKYIIGEGVKLFEGPTPNGGNTIWLQTRLFKSKELAKEVWEHLQDKGKMFYSIGGTVTARDSKDPKTVTKAQISQVALTTYPANPDAAVGIDNLSKSWALEDSLSKNSWEIVSTLEELAKALAAGAGPGLNSIGGRSLVEQDLEGAHKHTRTRAKSRHHQPTSHQGVQPWLSQRMKRGPKPPTPRETMRRKR